MLSERMLYCPKIILIYKMSTNISKIVKDCGLYILFSNARSINIKTIKRKKHTNKIIDHWAIQSKKNL